MAAGEADELRPFPLTSWGLVGRANREHGAGGREALGALLVRYQPALRARLVVERRIPPDVANDLLQGFITDRVIAQNLVARADREKGKFRTLLLTALDRHVVDQFRAATARKRTSGRAPVPLEAAAGVRDPSPGATPGAAFDVEWAKQVIAEAVDRMRAECHAAGRADLWGVFASRVLHVAVDGAEPLPYDRLVERFGFATPVQAANALVTAKRMFARALRSVVARYAGDACEVDREVEELRGILAGRGAESRGETNGGRGGARPGAD